MSQSSTLSSLTEKERRLGERFEPLAAEPILLQIPVSRHQCLVRDVSVSGFSVALRSLDDSSLTQLPTGIGTVQLGEAVIPVRFEVARVLQDFAGCRLVQRSMKWTSTIERYAASYRAGRSAREVNPTLIDQPLGNANRMRAFRGENRTTVYLWYDHNDRIQRMRMSFCEFMFAWDRKHGLRMGRRVPGAENTAVTHLRDTHDPEAMAAVKRFLSASSLPRAFLEIFDYKSREMELELTEIEMR